MGPPVARTFGGLGRAWLAVLGLAVALGAALQALGPPSAVPHAATAKPQPESIAALLNKVEDAISDSPDGAPPGADAAETLQKVAAALPGASREDRQLAKDMASDLYDRARIALNAGKIDAEQRWVALGAILAPPPDLGPVPANAAQPSGTAKAASQQAATPNAADTAAPKAAPEQAPAAQNAGEASGSAALAIHVAANSAAAGATAKTLADRLGSGVRTETVAASAAPPGAVICYGNPEDHDRAKAIGETLGGLGYYWRLQRSPTAQAGTASPHIDVWLPAAASGGRPPADLPENYCAARE
ncbi:MAG: hypothetical protein JO047_01640 [Alphaproteobacteria bacterium]|nr:hypothetical protein [Alphaproteobacteria bacterium]